MAMRMLAAEFVSNGKFSRRGPQQRCNKASIAAWLGAILRGGASQFNTLLMLCTCGMKPFSTNTHLWYLEFTQHG